MEKTEPVAIAILAKAPVPGLAKTRLIPVLGAEGAAAFAARLIAHAAKTAVSASAGPVTLWAAPDAGHPCFQSVNALLGVALARQGDGDLGARMLAAVEAVDGPVLIIGADCPALTPDHLRTAADMLRTGSDVVVGPAEDGGYVLIGMRHPQPFLFSDMRWSTAGVMEENRRRLRERGLTWQEPFTLWDVDVPADLDRLRQSGLHDLIPEQR